MPEGRPEEYAGSTSKTVAGIRQKHINSERRIHAHTNRDALLSRIRRLLNKQFHFADGLSKSDEDRPRHDAMSDVQLTRSRDRRDR